MAIALFMRPLHECIRLQLPWESVETSASSGPSTSSTCPAVNVWVTSLSCHCFYLNLEFVFVRWDFYPLDPFLFLFKGDTWCIFYCFLLTIVSVLNTCRLLIGLLSSCLHTGWLYKHGQLQGTSVRVRPMVFISFEEGKQLQFSV